MNAQTSQDLSKPLVLYFQEEATDNTSLFAIFDKIGVRTETHSDPREFLKRMNSARPAIACIDVSGMKITVASAILKSVRTIIGIGPPIFTLLNKGDQAIIKKMMDAGATGFLEKPVEIREIAIKLSRYIATGEIVDILSVPNAAKAETPATKKQPPIPGVVNWFFEKLAPILASLSTILEFNEDTEIQLKFYSQRLRPHAAEITKMVQTLRKSQDKLDLITSLRMYGPTNVRNIAVLAGLAEATGLDLFKWNPKNGMLATEPKDTIPMAIRCVNHFTESARYQSVAFVSGLVFDLLALSGADLGDRKRPFLKQLETSFTDAMKLADVGFKRGKGLEDLVLERHILTVFLMREAGRMAMALAYPDYLEFANKLEKAGVKPPLRTLAEVKKYGISSNVVSALICQIAPGLSDAYQSVLFFDLSFMLEKTKTEANSRALSQLCFSLVK